MARRRKTAFDRYFATRMKDSAFASEYEAARYEIDTVDALVRALDAAREKAGMTKAVLAKRAGMPPEVIRRLFTASAPNPTLDTVVKLLRVLDCSLGLLPRVTPRRDRPSRPGREALS